MPAGTLVEVEVVVVVVVDMVRTADLPKAAARLSRNVLEKARVTARRATKAVKCFVVKYELAVAVGCCSLGVSAIRRERSARPSSREHFIVDSREEG
jgi:hypothetical protein